MKETAQAVSRNRENVAEQNTIKGDSPTGVLRSPNRRKAVKLLQACYVQFAEAIPQFIIRDVDNRLKKAQWFYAIDEKGEIRQISGAVAGNKVAAWRTEIRMDDIFLKAAWDIKKCMFITVTHSYIKTEKGRQRSWEFFQEELPKYLRKLKAKGMTDFIVVKEAHADGGCHAHILCQWNRKFKTFEYKGKRRIGNKAIRDFIKNNWAGDVDILAIMDNAIEGYIKKYLGKYSHVEDALRRAKRGWSADGDMYHKETDCKKLWTNYYCSKLKIRRFTCSVKKEKPLSQETENVGDKTAAEPLDLVKNMNNSAEGKKAKIVRQILIPWHIKFNPAFEPVNGVIDKSSRGYQLAVNFIKDVTAWEREKKSEKKKSEGEKVPQEVVR